MYTQDNVVVEDLDTEISKKPSRNRRASKKEISVNEIEELPVVESVKPKWYDNTGKELIRFLRSRFNALSVSFILITLQTFHPAKVLYSFNLFSENPNFNIFYCYALAFFIEIFIIYYVVKENGSRKFSMSLWFCLFSIIINMYYYANHLCHKTGLDGSSFWELDSKLIPAMMFSMVIPLAIYRVSEKINEIENENRQE